jgi:transcriptional regulator with XRE-family HTH domain
VRVEWTPDEIRQRRNERGLSQEDLAEALQVSRRAITNWETGAAEPRGKSIRGLDRVLGDATAPEVSLRDASLMQLLAEIATRFAEAERAPGERVGPAERLKFKRADAPASEVDNEPRPGGSDTQAL